MDCTLEKECSALGGLFQSIVNDLKNAHPVWDDFAQKAGKLHLQLKATISALNFFLDALQKIADMATAAKGATRDIGTALTRICMRHRSVENRLKTLCSALVDCLVQPLLSKIDDWHKTSVQMDKDHSKEYKRCRQEIKKRTNDTNRLQKKLRRGQSGVQRMLESVTQEVSDRYMGLLDIERLAVRQAMVEQRAQYCMFVSWFKPVMDGEVSLLNEISQMSEVVDLLCRHSVDPYTLPQASEAVIMDAKGLENTWKFQTPPSSPGASSSSLGSRKSSFCSLNSSSTIDSQCLNDGKSIPGAENKSGPKCDNNGKLPDNCVTNGGVRYSSLSSQDSGFTSQDTLFGRKKSPSCIATLPAAIYVQPARFNSDEEDASTPASSTPSPSPSSATWPVDPDSQNPTVDTERPHTISAAYTSACSKRHALNRSTFVPPRPTALFKKASSYGLERNFDEQYIKEMSEEEGPNDDVTLRMSNDVIYTQPDPLNSLYTDPFPSKIPNFNQAQPDQIMFQRIYVKQAQESTPPSSHDIIGPILRMQNQSGSTNGRQSRRPLSFVATDNFELNSGGRDDDEDSADPPRKSRQILSLDHENCRYIGFLHDTTSMYQNDTAYDDVTSMIQSGALDNRNTCMITPYCTLPRAAKNNSAAGHKNGPISLFDYGFASDVQVNNLQHQSYGLNASSTTSMNTIVRRPSAQSGRPPPPPIRRTSAITSATPSAPAVDIVRSNSRCTTPVDGGYCHIPIYGTSIASQQHLDVNYSNPPNQRTTTCHQDINSPVQMRPQQPNAANNSKTYMQIRSSLRVKTSAENRNRSLPRV